MSAVGWPAGWLLSAKDILKNALLTFSLDLLIAELCFLMFFGAGKGGTLRGQLAGAWNLEPGGWRLEAGAWRLVAGGSKTCVTQSNGASFQDCEAQSGLQVALAAANMSFV